MKKIQLVLFTVCLSLSLQGQRNSDYGVFAGVSSYFGDINKSRPMYSPLPALGIFYRYNLHPRQSLRASLFFGGSRGDDLDFNNDFQRARASSFVGTVGELAVQFEFNFLPYTTEGRRWDYTPYLAAGTGLAYVNTTTTSIIPVIPFSIGFKLNVYKNLGLEAEYGFRKTFYDNFDGLKDFVSPDDYAVTHNNDWYTFTGVSFTWKIMSKRAECRVYDDVDSKRRR